MTVRMNIIMHHPIRMMISKNGLVLSRFAENNIIADSNNKSPVLNPFTVGFSGWFCAIF